jgi:hypothetical protein
MVRPDPALGISADFDGDQFRDSIRFSMQMGISPDGGKQPIFVFRSASRTYWRGDVQLTTTPRLDRDGKPLDPTVRVVESPPQTKRVDCAVEIERADAAELPVGNFRPTKATVTLLDQQYEQVKGARELVYNGDRYVYGYEPVGLGLFDVGVNQIIFYAVDES